MMIEKDEFNYFLKWDIAILILLFIVYALYVRFAWDMGSTLSTIVLLGVCFPLTFCACVITARLFYETRYLGDEYEDE